MKETLMISDEARGRPAIVVDFDATLWDLMRAIADLVAADHGMSVDDTYARLLRNWAACDELMGHEGTQAAFATAFQAEYMERFGLLPGAAQGLATLADEGYRIVVMTHRPLDNITHVARHLATHNAPVHEIQCGPAFDKVAASFEAGAHLLVDDKPDTILAAHRAGLAVTSLRWPYNAEVLDAHAIAHGSGWDTDLLEVIRASARPAALANAA